jgi:hypothetical protein
MQIFGVFVLWKRATAESQSYPPIQDILQANEQSPKALQDWKAAHEALASKVNTDDAFLFYNRLDMEGGDVLTMTYYTSKAAFDALVATHQAQFDEVHTARSALGEHLGLEITEKQTSFSLDQFDYDDHAAALEFFNALP